MKGVNIWLGLSIEFRVDLVGYVLEGTPPADFPLIVNLSEYTIDLFRGVHDADAIEQLFNNWEAPGGKTYQIWSMYTAKPEGVQTIKSDLEAMHTAYPADFMVGGGWHCNDGREIGTQWDYTDPDNPVITGDPTFPQDFNRLIHFMPDLEIPDEENPGGPTISLPATELTDVNLLLGQAPRKLEEAP